MQLTHISLTNFRNYARLELDLPAQPVIIVGGNAQGKSNLLEAIYFLATARSFRANSDRELINWLALEEELCFARLFADINKERGAIHVEITIKDESKKPNEGNGTQVSPISKRVKVNNIARRAIDLIGQVNVVMFSPPDIDLVSGAPQLRRRYLDVTISQVDPRYCRTLAHYNRVLLQRNHLLRQIRERHASVEQLVFWDQEMASAGAYLILQRWETVAALNELTSGLHRKLTGSQEQMHIGWRLSLDNGVAYSATANGRSGTHSFVGAMRFAENAVGGASRSNQGEIVEARLAHVLGQELDTATPEARVSAVTEVFRQALAKVQQRDIAYGASCIGPHRDDLTFLVDDRDMNQYGSRGQQRTVALSLKLAEMEFMRRKTGEEPILLLDDVASELDEQRRRHVVEAVHAHQQVILTTTSEPVLAEAFLEKPTRLRIENGAISQF